ncbi:hypothetical protein FRC09_016975 [Ceratobasidium sp. 395]|nr:hypothetical protein FRC09_016975 [Ceratobasidium sp. 395]
MSQTSSSQASTGAQSGSAQNALVALIVNHLNQQIVQPLETQLGAQNAQLNALAAQHTQFQTSVLSLLGGGDNAPPGPQANTRRSRRRGGSVVPKPDKKSATVMQNIVRRVIKDGCKIAHLKDAKLGLDEEELQDRIDNDPELPWRPDFLKSMSDALNKFWVDKILDATMANPKALAFVADGSIVQQFWTRDIVQKHILGPMWCNIRSDVKQRVDDEAAARGKANQAKTNRAGRKERLTKARFKLVTVGTAKQPKFQYKLNNVMRDIPPELIVEEAMSDVVAEEYDSEDIPAEVPRDQYCADRPKFEYEGRPPFWRRDEPWNKIFQATDYITSHKDKGFGIQPRYYAGDTTRGRQNNVSAERASEIPTSKLHRCHISKAWYDRLSEPQRNILKPSPSGWEVDEERLAVGLGESN